MSTPRIGSESSLIDAPEVDLSSSGSKPAPLPVEWLAEQVEAEPEVPLVPWVETIPSNTQELKRTLVGDADGSLARHLGEMSFDDQAVFLAFLEAKGVLTAIPAEGAVAAFEPPARPEMYENDSSLPKPLRDLVHAHNLVRAQDYCADFKGYLARYQAGVELCPDARSLREWGPPLAADVPVEVFTPRDVLAPGYQRDWLAVREFPSDARVHKAIADKLSDWSGEARAGTFFVEGDIEHQPFDLKKQFAKALTSLSPVNATAKEGAQEVTARVPAPYPGTSLSSYSHGSAETGRFGWGLQGAIKGGDLSEVTAKVGIGFVGLSRANANLAFNEVGVFGTPPELSAGTPWKDLNPERKDTYRRLGWTEDEWGDKRPGTRR